MSEFEGRVVVITGGAGGQGAAEAELFAAAGAHVVVADIKEEAGQELVARLRAEGGKADFLRLDVSKEADWAAAAEMVAGLGRLDVLINNAGIAHRFGLMDTEPARFEEVLAVNLTGSFLGIRALAPIMRDSGGGAIINIGSAAGMTGHFSAAYSSSKWGLRGLAKVAAMEFAGWNIRVNSVHPGIVDTAIVPGDTAFPASMTTFTPLGRPALPDDIAPTVMFLASDGARFITGADVSVDGGLVDIGVYDAVAKDYARRQAEAS